MKKLFLLILLLLLLSPAVMAVDVSAAQWDAIDSGALEEAAGESGVELELGEGFSLDEALSKVGMQAKGLFQDAVRSATRSAALLLVVVIFCETAELLFVPAKPGAEGITALVGTLAVTAVAVTDVSSLMELSRKAIDQISDFCTLLIPVLTASAVATGSVTAATARQGATLLLANVLVTLINRVLLPFVYLYVSACAASAALGNGGLGDIAKLLKWFITTTLTILLLLFTIYLSMTNFAAAGVDAVAIKLTRTVISNLVPVVGGILSDASETVLAGAALVRGTVGVFGVVAVLAYCVGPFLYLGGQYLAYRLAAVLTALVSRSRTATLIEQISGAFGLVMGMTGAVALLVMISIFATLTVAVH